LRICNDPGCQVFIYEAITVVILGIARLQNGSFIIATNQGTLDTEVRAAGTKVFVRAITVETVLRIRIIDGTVAVVINSIAKLSRWDLGRTGTQPIYATTSLTRAAPLSIGNRALGDGPTLGRPL
jgi:hypothetical protein